MTYVEQNLYVIFTNTKDALLRAICCSVTCSSSDCSHCGRSHFRSSDTRYSSCRDSHCGGGSVEAPLWSACQDSSTVCAHCADTGQCYYHHQSVLLCACREPISSLDVPTSTNEAYELTKQAGEEGHEYEVVSAPQPVAAGEGVYEHIP